MTQTRLNILDQQKPALSSSTKISSNITGSEKPLLVAPPATTSSLSRFFPSFSVAKLAASFPAESTSPTGQSIQNIMFPFVPSCQVSG